LLDFRWDEKADPPRSTLCCVGLQAYASSMWAQMEGGSAHDGW
jgi:hypothetical protein